jgi:pilus assembly protein CpaC
MLQFILFYLLFHCPRIWALENLHLTEGTKTILASASGSKAWVEDGSIVKLEQVQGHWSIQALRTGSSEIRIEEKRWMVSVLSGIQDRSFEVLQPITARTLGLVLSKRSRKVMVTGRLQRWQDWDSLASACSSETCEYEMRASVSPEVEKEIRKQLRKKLSQFSLFAYRLELTDRFQIHVSPQLPQVEKISHLMARYGVAVIKDSTSLEMQPLVKVQITVAEIKKEAFLNYGVQWPTSYSAQILPKTENPISPISLELQAMESNGTGRVLASPNLLCRSGKEAEFVAGGEFPIKIMNFKTQDVVWKRYGILLKIKPLADFSGRMSISLETEISSLDTAHTVDGIPGLFTNRVQSHFDLSEPRTIALSGLIKSESGQSKAGLPGLSRVPILGSLFSSKDFRESRTELVIFVRPEIIQEEDSL